MWLPVVILVIRATLSVAGSNCYDKVRKCWHYGAKGCKGEHVYNGMHNYTASGIPCQTWDSSNPRSIAAKYRHLPNNYCRNPKTTTGTYKGPWCYTMNPSKKYDFCFKSCLDCYDKVRKCWHYGAKGCKGEHVYNGMHNYTLSGILCQTWDSSNPRSIAVRYRYLPKNYCRNPKTTTGTYKGPWCYTMNPSKKYDFCFKSCSDCYDKVRKCWYYGAKGCKGEHAYNGTHNYTVTGIPCQTWDSSNPRSIASRYRYLPKNYCRNPKTTTGTYKGPWCYTMNPSKKYDFCFKSCSDVKQPPSTTRKSAVVQPVQPDATTPPSTKTKSAVVQIVQPDCRDKQRDCYHVGRSGCDGKLIYSGTRSRTLNGYVCQKWALDYPHNHSYHSQPENYCRNPSGEIRGPWCYTTSDKRFDYCFRDCRFQCLKKPVDLMVLMDASGSIKPTNFGKEKDLVIEIIKKLPANSRVAVLQFSDYHKWELKFENRISLGRAMEKVSTIIYIKDRDTHIAKALRMAYEEAERYNPKNMTMLTITDGHGRDWDANEGTKYSNKILNAGVASYAVAIGGAANRSQLTEIVGISDRILTAQKFSELDEMFAQRVIKMICTAPSGRSRKKEMLEADPTLKYHVQ